jgi:hypothetical protein
MRCFKVLIPVIFFLGRANAQDTEAVIVSKNSYNLSDSGKAFLLKEARQVDLFMLGELHGEKEIPNLLTSLWPHFVDAGYRHIAAEVSEWAAAKLMFPERYDSLKVEGLWTNQEARKVQSTGSNSHQKLIWGCDMEEISLGQMINELFENEKQTIISQNILKALSEGYSRNLAPKILSILGEGELKEKFKNNSQFQSILISLKIDSARAFPKSRFDAQLLREDLIKRNFLKNYQSDSAHKILLRFGRNHLHYGFDERGISTLGNFIAEFSISKNLRCFNVATFAVGGECRLLGNTFNADERSDDIAFEFLFNQSKYDATLFDLRPLRVFLHSIVGKDRSELQRRLLYWADSYDSIICFKKVTAR